MGNECITFPGMAAGLRGAAATPPEQLSPKPKLHTALEPLGTVWDGQWGHSSKGAGGLPREKMKDFLLEPEGLN